MRPTLFKISVGILLAIGLLVIQACSSHKTDQKDHFTNPIVPDHENTSLYFHDGLYYYITNTDGVLNLYVHEDPTRITQEEPSVACPTKEKYGLLHLWHPQITFLRGKWYIYISADDGNTDNHHIYVLENPEKDPRKGSFTMRGRIQTDPDDNWAIHPHAFEYDRQLYLIWSGWESRRVYAETQCIYIAKLENPWTQASPRVRISSPEYEWERQWVNPDGYKTAYPVYVNEAPFFFGNERTDRLYIYYSASALWTAYYAIGELSAAKGADLLRADSWKKSNKPVFAMNDPAWPDHAADSGSDTPGVYAPGYPYIIPSPDTTEYFLVYMARDMVGKPNKPYSRTVRMQKIGFSSEGHPELGIPVPAGVPLKKPSGIAPHPNQ